MPGNFKHEDLRIIKTHKALLDALSTLLSKRNFGRITVNDICEESQMSRTAFYSHFNDKYDLLWNYLTRRILNTTLLREEYPILEKEVNKAVDTSKSIITNLLVDANNETTTLVKDFISMLIDEFMGIDGQKKAEPFYIALYSFCVGGIYNLVLWQIKNKFPVNLKIVNVYFFQIIDTLRKLEKDKSEGWYER